MWGRLTYGADPTAMSRFWTIAQCSISSAGDAQDHPAPPLDGRQLVVAQIRVRRALEAERRVEVLAHESVLELCCLAEQVGQLLAVPHDDGRLSPHRGNVPPATAVFNGENIRDNSAVTRSGKHRVLAATPPGRGDETGHRQTEQHATLTREAARNRLLCARPPSPTRRYSADRNRRTLGEQVLVNGFALMLHRGCDLL